MTAPLLGKTRRLPIPTKHNPWCLFFGHLSQQMNLCQPYLLLQGLPPVSDEEQPDGGQDGEDEVGPVELVPEARAGEEVAEHDEVDDGGDDVQEDLEAEQVVHLAAQAVQVRVDAAHDVQLL